MSVDVDGVQELTLRETLVWELHVAKALLADKDTPKHRRDVELAYRAFDDLHEVGGLRDCE